MKQFIFLLFILILGSCVSTKTAYHIPIRNQETPKKLLVFIDGTMNNASSYTNVFEII